MKNGSFPLSLDHSSLFSSGRELLDHINGRWHQRALGLFLMVVLGHWAEHVAQVIQIWVLHWPRANALGVLGVIWPWLVSSESLHYVYALIMLVGLVLLRPAFTGEALRWWSIAIVIQVWHHFEHLLLLGQVIVGHNLFGAAVPMSVLQLFFPRVELHLTYNAMVFFPMVLGMYYHRFPPKRELIHSFPARPRQTCSCMARVTTFSVT